MNRPASWAANLLVFLLTAAIAGCAATVARPVHQPPSAAPAIADVRTQVATRVRESRYPGAMFAVARGDRVLDLQAVSRSHVETHTAMRTDDIFRMMSMTKPVTAVAAMIPVEKGSLRLDDPVSRVLPEFAVFGVPGAPALTLRHLMTHTSGIGFGSVPRGPNTLDSRAKDIAARHMQLPAGKQWAYSGFDGPDVIARIAEVAAGVPYDQFIKRSILDPLGMDDSARLSSFCPDACGQRRGRQRAHLEESLRRGVAPRTTPAGISRPRAGTRARSTNATRG